MLPQIKEVKLPQNNFPTKWQAVIFRNYGLISTDKIAKTLDCSEEVVESEAARLGLGDISYNPDWETRGYITLIRNNWFLLPYGQLITLLGVTEEKLDFWLEKEDFLYVKLGEFKPACEEVKYEPLTEIQAQETARIAELISANNGERTAKPFDFFTGKTTDKKSANGKHTRIVHGYLTPCGDVFKEDNEKYLPDTLLQAYAEQGVNGLWFHGLLSALSPYPFKPSVSEGYQERRAELKKLISRCKAYGIKVYLYVNEPRDLFENEFGKYAYLMGRRQNGRATFCLEQEETQKYLYEAFKDLLTAVPDLGGFLTITMSENPTHCHYLPNTNCPVCKNIPAEYSAAKVNNIIQKAVRDSGSGAEVIANLWGWSTYMQWTDEQTLHGVELLDKDISVLCVSEFDLDIEKGGTVSRIIDYSIGNPGPSEITRKTLKKAQATGHKTYAKIQLNNSWECSAVPYLPVFDLTYEHLCNLDEIGVRDYMLTWTLGGYPSAATGLVTAFAERGKDFSLQEWYQETYGKESVTVKKAVQKFCAAFREYPFSVESLYFSPKTLGAANLWEWERSEKHSTMVCYGYDDYESWISPYPYETYVSQYDKLLALWKEGLTVLENAGDNEDIQELKTYAKAAYLHFEADALQTKFSYYKRDRKKYEKELALLIERAKQATAELLKLVRTCTYVGFETSNHYYYSERDLLEKLINLQSL